MERNTKQYNDASIKDSQVPDPPLLNQESKEKKKRNRVKRDPKYSIRLHTFQLNSRFGQKKEKLDLKDFTIQSHRPSTDTQGTETSIQRFS